MSVGVTFPFAGDPCPICCRPLRPVAGGQRVENGQALAVHEYRCERGHAFHAKARRRAFDAVLHSGLYEGNGIEEGARVHFA